MGFLCSNHKQFLTANPKVAQKKWHQIIRDARQLVTEEQWSKAVIYYGNALEVSDILLTLNSCEKNQERYVQTALEMMHAVRNSQHQAETVAFYHMVVNRLNKEPLPVSFDTKLSPLKEVAFESLAKVNQWMQQWHAIIHGPSIQLH